MGIWSVQEWETLQVSSQEILERLKAAGLPVRGTVNRRPAFPPDYKPDCERVQAIAQGAEFTPVLTPKGKPTPAKPVKKGRVG